MHSHPPPKAGEGGASNGTSITPKVLWKGLNMFKPHSLGCT